MYGLLMLAGNEAGLATKLKFTQAKIRLRIDLNLFRLLGFIQK